ncbi:uncharacterized protein SPPG_04835 [Spizellomyces punctatus DAOM BR117]|uniref:MYCBP-associated protein n=1 Tax=Spizellomyces punctatus (strain DAOM BR117) TaxID=645134 RepID=A0A0L0HI67_SPIPD|nr:uncharacterized protein SPPG_04835 [Spizellomyces punctatus DAOM BR117]KND00524.1 hypothetical protein SPPG_04835 [Spizellomyces punctatus DAOM BR117]|eukprot:XP_016608563.1 hypothetical protein SPPG_04835 [Spizellomyces punctatus DAOM BR117]
MGQNRPYVLVAKEVPPDVMGEDLKYTQPERKPVPVSFVRHKEYGPRRAPTGRILPHTILGSADEFEELERLERGVSEGYDGGESEEEREEEREREREREEKERSDREEKRRRVEEERQRWLGKLRIFQRYIELRETHALKTWTRHSHVWSKNESHISKATRRSKSHLLMSRLNTHRQKVERSRLIETALRVLEEEHVEFWRVGCRVGSELLGLVMPIPKGGPRQIERVRTIDTAPPPSNDYYVQKAQELSPIISLFDPFHELGDGGYMEVRGHSILSNRMTSLVEKLVTKLDDQNPPPPVTEPEPQTSSPQGPILHLPQKRLTFTTDLSETTASVLTIYNTGSTAIRFEISKVEMENAVGVKEVRDGVQRFYLKNCGGMILPGLAWDVGVAFKSCRPGVYTEKWKIITVPDVGDAEEELVVTLQGIAIEPDTTASKRVALERLLHHREATTAAKTFLNSLLTSITKPPRTKPPKATATLSDKNPGLGLEFSARIVESLESLAQEAYRVVGVGFGWDGSVLTLYNVMNQISEAELRSTYLRRLNECIDAASKKDVGNGESLLNVVGYDIVASLADQIAETSEVLRKRMGLPVVRAATKFFDDEKLIDLDGGLEGPPSGAGTAPIDAARRATPPVTQPSDAGDKGKKGSVASKEPAAKKASTPGPTGKPGTKGGPKSKTVEINLQEPEAATPHHPIVLAKVSVKPRKLDSSKGWTRERRQMEDAYKREFKQEAWLAVASAITRLCDLFADLDG